MSSTPTIAISGWGVTSPAGAGARALAEAIAAGASRIGPIPDAVALGLSLGDGARFDDALTRVPPGHPDRGIAALAAAIAEALDAAGRPDPARTGLTLGTALGAMERDEAAAAPALALHAVTDEVADAAGLGGPRATFSVTCASALCALEQAAADLAFERADAMVVAGLETLSRFMLAGFASLEAIALPPSDRHPDGRPGIVLGEAAAACVLEPLARARARGVEPPAIVAGRSLVSDAVHLTSPDLAGAGMAEAIAAALDDASVAPADVDLVTLTAAGTPVYDAMYDAALARAFDAAGAARPPRASWESVTGHVLAATGAVGLGHAAQLVAAKPRRVLALTVGFGGQNGAVLVAPPPGGEA